MTRSLIVLLILAIGCVTGSTQTTSALNDRACEGVLAQFVADTAVDGAQRLGEWQARPTQSVARYPREMLSRRVEGRVTFSFVIDTLGAVVPGSGWIHEETDYAFGQQVCAWLRQARFSPLRLDGRARSVLVRRLEHRFRIRG